MQFQTMIRKLKEMGFKSFDSVEYFFYFAKNEGKSVREMTNGDPTEYQKALRHFKLMSSGTKHEVGMGLFETESVTRTRVQAGRYPNVDAIKLTTEGKKLLRQLKPVKRSMTRTKPKATKVEDAKSETEAKAKSAVKSTTKAGGKTKAARAKANASKKQTAANESKKAA